MTPAVVELIDAAQDALLDPRRLHDHDALFHYDADFRASLFDSLADAAEAAPRAALLAARWLERILDTAEASDQVQDQDARALVLDDAWRALTHAVNAAEGVSDPSEQGRAAEERRRDATLGVFASAEAGVDVEPRWAAREDMRSPSATPEDGLALQRHGFALLPLNAADKRPNARVLERVHGTTSWPALTASPASPEEVRRWFDVDPETNLGILTGSASGELAVADVDDLDRCGVRHPPTPTVDTGRGRHLYFRGAPGQRGSTFDGGDLKAGSAYVVAPPSLHASGVRYGWSLSPDDVPLAELADVRGLGTPAPDLVPGPTSAPTDVGALLRDRDTVRRLLPFLGIPARAVDGHAFCCVLPGHEERHPSASLNPDGFMYADWHRRDGGLHLSLQEVYAFQLNGRPVQLRGQRQVHAMWGARLLHAAGVLRLDVPRLPLPDRLPTRARTVAEGFALAFALNLRAHPDAPAILFPTGKGERGSFAADWCAVSPSTAWRGLGELVACGAVRKVGTLRLGRGPANLYMPGDGTIPRRKR